MSRHRPRSATPAPKGVRKDARAKSTRAKSTAAKSTAAKSTAAKSTAAKSTAAKSAPAKSPPARSASRGSGSAKPAAAKSVHAKQPHAATRGARSTAGPRAQRASARRDAILAAALAEFSKRGFATTRIDDVARRARVAKGTIYLYFKDKDTLFQELVRTTLVPTLARLSAPLPEGLPTRALFEAFVEAFVDEIVATPRVEIMRLMIAEGKQFPALAEFYYREVVSKGLAAMRALIERGRARGEINVAALARNPQLAIAPLMVTVVWNGLFGKFAKVDARDMMKTQLDLMFGRGRPE